MKTRLTGANKLSLCVFWSSFESINNCNIVNTAVVREWRLASKSTSQRANPAGKTREKALFFEAAAAPLCGSQSERNHHSKDLGCRLRHEILHPRAGLPKSLPISLAITLSESSWYPKSFRGGSQSSKYFSLFSCSQKNQSQEKTITYLRRINFIQSSQVLPVQPSSLCSWYSWGSWLPMALTQTWLIHQTMKTL